MPKIYSDEFKASALELLEQGITQKQVCQDLGMSKSALQGLSLPPPEPPPWLPPPLRAWSSSSFFISEGLLTPY
ncbi:transposase [Citricoccus sp. GCM10030269]|uniref:transposase n=1 Tax=Citricoccus sp. GCM10030269 TaxID=3273388 RepID=UPI0036158994